MSHADLIFLNGFVHTVNDRDDVAEALAVRGDRILAVGGRDDVLAHRGPRTRVVDLRGGSLLPGFIEAHCHLPVIGLWGAGIDCKYPAVRSIEEICRAVADRARAAPPGAWIRGRGYDHLKLAEGRHPTRHDLDRACPDRPVQIVRTCGHISAVNSKALEMAGITAATPDPPGGQIDRDERGEPTGVLRESAHMAMLKLARYEDHEVDEALERSARLLLSQGITSAHDAGGYGASTLNAMARAARDGRMKLRVYAMMWSLTDVEPFLDAAAGLGITTGVGDDRFRIGPYKIMVDGSSSGPTAGTREDYASDPGNRGILYYTQEQVNEHYRRAARQGFQLTAHAVGDRGIEMVLDGIEAAMRAAGVRPGARSAAGLPLPLGRNRIEHCAMCFPDLMERVQRLGIVPVAQPVFFHEFGDGYVRNYGPERAARMFPCKSFLRRGIPVAGSSDAPVTHSHPLLGLSVAVTRRTMSGQVVGPAEALTISEAIRIYTRGGAYAEFAEDRKGSLEVGKLADLVWLGAPIHRVPPDELPDVPVAMTVVGGEIVHEGARA